MAGRNRLTDLWPSDDGSADDAENYFDFGLWKQTSQPLQRRGTILPFGQYEDGSIAPAWPAALADPYEAAVRGLEGPDAVRPEDALIAAGGAALGGIPFAAKGAVGSAGGRLMSNQSAPIRAYHGTSEVIDTFNPAIRGETTGADSAKNAFWFSSDPSLASDYAVLAGDGELAAVSRRLAAFEDKARSGDILTAQEAIEARILYAKRDELEAAVKAGERIMVGANVIPVDLRFNKPLVKDYGGQPYRDESYSELVHQAMESGNDGVILRNTYDPAFPEMGRSPVDVFGAIRPGTVFSATTGKQLFSNPKEAAIAPAAVNALTDNTPTGIRAYHGSPHDFDRFSLDKIGTGEGAQAYGHGLYFAENEGVARSYRDGLAPGWQPTINGKKFQDLPESERSVAQWMQNTGGHPDEIARISEERAAKVIEEGRALGYEDLAELEAKRHLGIAAAAREIAKGGKWDIGAANNGRMYEVNIKADPEQFLDWDLPLSQQPKALEAFRSLKLPPEALDDLGGDLSTIYNAEMPRDAYDTLATLSGIGDLPGASRMLREAGIPGIRYLDQGSRAAGEGSRNYVVFDDNLIDILRKYANAPTGAPFALAGDEFDIEGNALMDALRRRQEVY